MLSIVIVNWNVRDLLDACLASIFASTLDAESYEIIVVDSASTDGSTDMLRQKYPSVILLPQAENIGFTRGNNLGLAQAMGDFLFLLNPDTELCPTALAQLLDYMQANPAVGILGPHTLNTDGSHQSTRRRFPTLITGIFESTWLSFWAPAAVERDYRLLDTGDKNIIEVDWVQGSAFLLRREVYQDIGGLDDGYIMYYEELDYCRRAKSAGWQIVYHGGAKITHHGGKSSEQASAFKHIHFQTSKLRYFRVHHGYGAYIFLRALLLILFGWQLILESFKGMLGHKRELRTERVRTYWQVLRSGLKAKL
ncbi:MAG: glycosyltransferase family 2 protein [Chloroflexi bacterium]|nr:glycosyltransferase family 2 protein [Chloroflexota bacterium]